ncbi:MAG: hypothetical protein U0103_02945 [Candidatus Obscuribacterales bacterium]
MTTPEPLNPWKLSGYRPGQRVVCKIIGIEPDGYSVIVSKDKLPGFLLTTEKHEINEELITEFVRAEIDRLVLCPDTDKPRPVFDLTKCRELDRKILEAKSLDEARLTATQIMDEIDWEQETQHEVESIIAALVLNTGRFMVRGESPLRRMRDILDCDLDTLNSLLHHQHDEFELFLDFKKVTDPLNVMDRLSARLSEIVQYPPRGTRIKN